jgi:anti-anti-sigma regulatory factor
MTTSVNSQRVDGEHVAEALTEIREKLNNSDGEVALDFSDVRRIDPSGLRAVEEFASAADEKRVKVVLRSVQVDVYKVLKLARLTTRFAFVS